MRINENSWACKAKQNQAILASNLDHRSRKEIKTGRSQTSPYIILLWYKRTRYILTGISMIKSPCVRICALNESGICVGCGMCIRDLRTWRSTDDQTRQNIVRDSRDRLKRMQNMRDEDFLHDDEK